MKIITPILAIMLIILLFACEQLLVKSGNSLPVQLVENNENLLVINEINAKGSEKNEFGVQSDWIEIYNSSDGSIQIADGEWTITDNPDNPLKFAIPAVLIPAHSYLLIWCDGADIFEKDIHANFKLNASGESIGLYRNGVEIELITFSETTYHGNSIGRIEDGFGKWTLFDNGSPGATNVKLLSDHN